MLCLRCFNKSCAALSTRSFGIALDRVSKPRSLAISPDREKPLPGGIEKSTTEIPSKRNSLPFIRGNDNPFRRQQLEMGLRRGATEGQIVRRKSDRPRPTICVTKGRQSYFFSFYPQIILGLITQSAWSKCD
jgi:hypothetical protein